MLGFKTIVLSALLGLTLAETDPSYYDPVEYQSYNVHHYSEPYMPYTAFQYRPQAVAQAAPVAAEKAPMQEALAAVPRPVLKSVPASIISTLPAQPLAPTYDTGFYTANPGGLYWNPLPYAYGSRVPYVYRY